MIFHLLTAVLFLLKVLGVITVSWWIVLAPSLVLFAFSIFAMCFVLICGVLVAIAGER